VTPAHGQGAGGAADALVIRNLSKRFGGAMALNDVGLSIRVGEVHGLLGTNGSGKSTLIKILSGFHTPEPGGRVTLFGKDLPLPVPGPVARERGLAFVHQHLGLIPSLTVTENLRLSRLSTEADWSINWRREHAEAAKIFARYGLALDPRAPVASLSAVEQALLAIVRAVEELKGSADAAGGGVLVLDEPTPFLPRTGVEQLFRLVRQVSEAGAAVIFVSHDVDEVREITDRCTILRNGHVVDTVETAATDHAGFVERIVGRSVQSFHVHKHTQVTSEPDYRITDLEGPGVGPVDIGIDSGEILGVTGLIGSGADSVCGMIYGASAPQSGSLAMDAERVALRDLSPGDAIARGIVYLPADRLGAAGVGGLSVADNVSLPVLDQLRNAFGLDRSKLTRTARALGEQAGVVPNNPDLPLTALSGGNQQKALVAKWLQTKPRLILLDEPTQGVDVGARQVLWGMLDAASADGAAVLISSTDYDQLAQICHRVLIFARGRVIAELSGPSLTKDSISEHCYRTQSDAA